jgi:hypothetical protein
MSKQFFTIFYIDDDGSVFESETHPDRDSAMTAARQIIKDEDAYAVVVAKMRHTSSVVEEYVASMGSAEALDNFYNSPKSPTL